MAGQMLELEVNHSLLDPNFDGYKLSLDKLPLYEVTIDALVDEAKLTDSQYSYQHIKAFGVHNSLLEDPWNTNAAYFVDQNWKIWKLVLPSEGRPTPPTSVLHIPNSSSASHTVGRHNVTLSFPDENWAVLADGAGHLHVIQTQDRKHDLNWEIRFSKAVLSEERCFTVVSSALNTDNEALHLDCLLLSVCKKDDQEEESEENKSAFITHLDWITLMSANGMEWVVERKRQLHSDSSPDYASLDSSGKQLILASQKPTYFVSDSMKPIEKPKAQAKAHAQPDPQHPAYTWLQSSDEVTVTFPLPPGVSKADILFKLTSDSVELGIKNGAMLLQGQLFERVDVEESTWTIADKRLELILFKLDKTTWPIVVAGDTRGEMVVDTLAAEAIHERLAHLTSETWNPDPSTEDKSLYNTQELEECDAFPEQTSVLQHLDGESHQCTHQVSLGANQWLFNQRLAPGKPPAICLRHDVDGVIWRPMETAPADKAPWEHAGTFNALGYVQASKQQKKFAGCAADLSYSVLVDCTRHAYIYRKPMAITSPLRNRKTGQKVDAIAKQQVVTLDTSEEILGMHVTDKQLALLVGKTIYVIIVNSEEDL